MRIGLLTHHWVYNFGANLQALATYKLLVELGHDVVLLNYRTPAKQHFYDQEVSTDQSQIHEYFCNHYLSQTELLVSESDLVTFCSEQAFDMIIVGSDVVFRLEQNSTREDLSFPNPYWLLWAKSHLRPVPRTASLAASAMGTYYRQFPQAIQQGIGKAVREMNYVSVRDRWTKLSLIWTSRAHCWPKLCPDPVFVLNDVMEIPEKYTEEPSQHRNQYIILSIYENTFPDGWIAEFVGLAHKQELDVYSLPHSATGKVDIQVDRVIDLPLSPLAWYAWISHAAGYIGLRFHPVVCSLANEVPFISCDTYQMYRPRISSKTYDLCKSAKVPQLCLHVGEFARLSPQSALQMLLSQKEKNYARRYTNRARRSFRRTVEEILVCKT